MQNKQWFLAAAVGISLLTIPDAWAGYSTTVQALKPIGYWPLNEKTPPPSATTTLATNYGTITTEGDVTFAGDVIYGYPGALAGSSDSSDSFNGFNTLATAQYTPAVSISPSFTIEAWLLTHDDGTLKGTTCPLSDINAASPREGWLIYMDIANVGQYTFRAYAENGTSPALSLNIGAAGSIQPEKWYHLAIVVSNAVTTTNVYAYLNGQLAAGPVTLPAYVPNNGANGAFTLGTRSDKGFFFDGALDEVAYYANALDPAIILSHYQTGTNPAPATAYSTLVQQQNPVLYYKLNESKNSPYPAALPVASNLGTLGTAGNGYYLPGTTPGSVGPTNSGFGTPSYSCGVSLDGTQSSTTSGPGVFAAPYDQAALNPTNGITLAAWVQVPASTVGWFQTVIGRSDSSYRFNLDTTGFPHFAANPNSDVVGTNALNDGAWHFWTGVFDPATKTSFLYIDGIPVDSAAGAAESDVTSPLLFGGACDYQNRNFVGYLAHVALFNRALTPSEIGTIYGAAGTPPEVALTSTNVSVNEGANATIVCNAAGSPTLKYQWYAIDLNSNTTLLTGQTNSTLALTAVTSSLSGYQYYVTVSNGYGTATSDITTLTVNAGPPTIQLDLTPDNQSVPVGASVTYTVSGTGTLPLSYSWYLNGVAISGATNTTLTIVAASGSNSITAKVSNSYGSISSSPAALIGLTTTPPIVAFTSDGSDWTVNGTASFTGTVLTLTDGAASETGTAFYNYPQYIDGFVAKFTYTPTGSSMADGSTFMVQRSPAGLNAIGGGGGQLAYSGIANSAAFEMNIYTGSRGGVGIQFGENGDTPGSVSTLSYMSTSPVALDSTDPIAISLCYVQGKLYATLTDTVTVKSYSTVFTVGNINTAIGSDTAYVGFSGATGGNASVQTISDFAFSYTTPPTLTVNQSGTNVVIRWPISVSSRFGLQSAATVNATTWANVTTTPTVSGLYNQVTLPASSITQFYRLVLQ